MLAVRGFRVVALVVAFVLALAGIVVGTSLSAKADVGDHISGSVEIPNPDYPADPMALPTIPLQYAKVYLSGEISGLAGPAFVSAPLLTDASGFFQFDDVDDGLYFVVVDAGDNWVQAGGDATITAGNSVDLGPIVLEPGVLLSGTVRDAMGTPPAGIPKITVCAYGTFSSPFPFGCFADLRTLYVDLASSLFFPLTGSDGKYAIVVPRDEEFELSAFDSTFTYAEQSWNHVSGCGCSFDPIAVPLTGSPTPLGPYDFDLFPDDGTIDFDLLVQDTAADPYEGVTANLFYKTPTGYRAIDHADTDLSGLTNLYGTVDGDYALKFAVGTVLYPVVSYDLGGGPIVPPNSCLIELPGQVTGGLNVLVDVIIDRFAKPCGYVPPSTSNPTTKKPRISSFSFEALPTPSATPTPSAPPTSTPSPSPTQTSEPSPTPTPDPAVDQNPFDLWWLWLILLILVALIIIVIVRLVTRR